MIGKTAEITRQHNDRAWSAWHGASWSRSKRLPKLRRVLSRDPSSKPQTPQQMLAIAKQWTLLLGGEVKGKSN